MVSVLRNRWLLLRLAAGISRADTPRGWVLNALRAVNFVLVTFAFGVLIFAIVWAFLPGLVPNTAIAIIASFIGLLFAIFLIPKLLNFPVKSISGIGVLAKAEIKGYALALAISSASAFIYWIGPTMNSGGGDIGALPLPTLRIAVLPWSAVIFIITLLFVSYGFTSWKVRSGYDRKVGRVILWVVNGVFFVSMLALGWLAWLAILAE